MPNYSTVHWSLVTALLFFYIPLFFYLGMWCSAAGCKRLRSLRGGKGPSSCRAESRYPPISNYPIDILKCGSVFLHLSQIRSTVVHFDVILRRKELSVLSNKWFFKNKTTKRKKSAFHARTTKKNMPTCDSIITKGKSTQPSTHPIPLLRLQGALNLCVVFCVVTTVVLNASHQSAFTHGEN